MNGNVLFAMFRLVVQLAAAMVGRIQVVVGDAFAAQVVECGLHTAGDHLWSGAVLSILKRFALVLIGDAKKAECLHRFLP